MRFAFLESIPVTLSSGLQCGMQDIVQKNMIPSDTGGAYAKAWHSAQRGPRVITRLRVITRAFHTTVARCMIYQGLDALQLALSSFGLHCQNFPALNSCELTSS